MSILRNSSPKAKVQPNHTFPRATPPREPAARRPDAVKCCGLHRGSASRQCRGRRRATAVGWRDRLEWIRAVRGQFTIRRFPDHWHSFRGRRLPTGTSRREEPWPGRYHRSVAADGCALTGATRSRVLLKKALRLWCVRMVATDVIDWEFL